MSVPSVVFAEASWYGSLRAGIQASDTTGVANGSSRFGVMGSSEVSEGLTAVYQFEHGIDSTTGNLGESGRLAYVGLSGGFGTLSMGRIFAASGNSFGAITDNSVFLGSSGVNSFISNALSYAVSVENISIQIDAGMNNGLGARSTAAIPAVVEHGDPAHESAAVIAKAEDKNVDEVELGVSMGLGESAKIALAHISHDTADKVKTKGTFLGGEYSIGGMTMYLGVGREKTKDNTTVERPDSGDDPIEQLRSQTDSTTFAGVRGSVGDTGVSYVFQARSKKTKGQNDLIADQNTDDSTSKLLPNKHSPWLLAVSRTLGGGASVHFEHSDPDKDGEKSTSYLALKIDF